MIGAVHGDLFTHKLIDPQWFSIGQGLRSVISSTVLEIIRECSSPNHIVLCRSDLFDQTARDLTRLDFHVERAVINGRLQDCTETAFFDHLIEMGLPEYIRSHFPAEGLDKSRCYRALNQFCTSYLLSDFEKRADAAKKHSKSFHKLKKIDVERSYIPRIKGTRARRCVECGEGIERNAYRCRAGTHYFYVHTECVPWVDEEEAI